LDHPCDDAIKLLQYTNLRLAELLSNKKALDAGQHVRKALVLLAQRYRLTEAFFTARKTYSLVTHSLVNDV
jgi:hypothetical protein